jgi:hypothetical protein
MSAKVEHGWRRLLEKPTSGGVFLEQPLIFGNSEYCIQVTTA